jgi:hypothetical protein
MFVDKPPNGREKVLGAWKKVCAWFAQGPLVFKRNYKRKKCFLGEEKGRKKRKKGEGEGKERGQPSLLSFL